jgi:hypothetical protein
MTAHHILKIAADRIEALEAEVERLRAALEAIAVRAGTFEGRGSYIAYVELAGEIEKMADAAIRAAAGGGEDPLPHLNDAQKALFVSALLGKHQPGDAGPTTDGEEGKWEEE